MKTIIGLVVVVLSVHSQVLRNTLSKEIRLMESLSSDLDSLYIRNSRFKEDDLDEMVKDLDNDQSSFEDLQ